MSVWWLARAHARGSYRSGALAIGLVMWFNSFSYAPFPCSCFKLHSPTIRRHLRQPILPSQFLSPSSKYVACCCCCCSYSTIPFTIWASILHFLLTTACHRPKVIVLFPNNFCFLCFVSFAHFFCTILHNFSVVNVFLRHSFRFLRDLNSI